MTERHELVADASGPGLEFFCPESGCGRRLHLHRRTGALTILHRGDPYAVHRGHIGDVTMDVAVGDGAPGSG